jgi:glycosyltransferase involved in cell wall biosynthesis
MILFFTIPWFRRVLKYSDAIVGGSDQEIEELKREFRIDEGKLFLVYVGIDTELFKPDKHKREFIRKKFFLSEEDKVLLMAGVVHNQKGMPIGLRAFVDIKREISNCKMMIVGDGPQLQTLKKTAKDLNIENDVIFCGFVANEKLPFYYNAADMLLNPPVRIEGLSFVIIEAMACGLPLVTTRVGGIASTIDEGISGFFVKPRDEKSLAEKAIEVLSNKELSERFGKNARAKALAQFDRENMVTDYLNISLRLIN